MNGTRAEAEDADAGSVTAMARATYAYANACANRLTVNICWRDVQLGRTAPKCDHRTRGAAVGILLYLSNLMLGHSACLCMVVKGDVPQREFRHPSSLLASTTRGAGSRLHARAAPARPLALLVAEMDGTLSPRSTAISSPN